MRLQSHPVVDLSDPAADPRSDLTRFASGILEAKSRTNRDINAQPLPNRPGVETSFAASPMVPRHFDPPKGRTRGGSPETVVPGDAAVAPTGAFYGRYVDEDGDTYLQGGIVVSGSGSFTLADRKVIDATTGPVESDGDILYVEATVNGYVVDGVLLGGLTATAAVYDTGASIPNNTLPTASSSTGKKVHIEVGRYTETDFLPSGTGHINITFCPGSYTVSRF